MKKRTVVTIAVVVLVVSSLGAGHAGASATGLTLDPETVSSASETVTVEVTIDTAGKDVVVGIDADGNSTIESDEVLDTVTDGGSADLDGADGVVRFDVTPTDAAGLNNATTGGFSVAAVQESSSNSQTPEDGTDDVSPFSLNNAEAFATLSIEGPVENIDTGETFVSIQGAIDDSDTVVGNTIVVGNGTFDESVTVDVPGITLRSEHGPSATTVVGNGGPGVTVAASGVNISEFTVRNPEGKQGVVLGSGTTTDDVTVEGNVIEDLGTQYDGSNQEHDARDGVFVGADSDRIVVRDNVIRNLDSVGDAASRGVHLDGVPAPTQVTVTNNTVEDLDSENNAVGLFVNANASDVTIRDNEVRDAYADYNSSRSPFAYAGGIQVGGDSDRITVANNTVSNVTTDNYTTESSSFAGTTLIVASGVDVATMTVSNNSFTGTSDLALQNKNTSVTLVAEDNYWGSSAGPNATANTYEVDSQGGTIDPRNGFDNVDFAPWRTSAGGPSFAPVENLDTGETFASIQAALDDPGTTDGHAIELADGTFSEQVVIDRNITLIGSGEGQTVVKSPADLDTLFTFRGDDSYPVVLVNGSDADVRNLTVDGDGQGDANREFFGVAYVNASGTVSNVTVTGVRESPLSGNQHGVAVGLFNQDGTSRTATLRDATLVDYQKNGFVGHGDGLTARVVDTTVIGAGLTGKIGQNGIQISGSAVGVVRNNTVSGHNYTGTPPTQTADVLLFGHSTAETTVVANNTLSDSRVGVAVASSPAVEIRDNNFENHIWHVLDYNTDSLNASALYGANTYDAATYIVNETTGAGVNVYGEIQAAVNQTAPNETVLVQPGTYREAVDVTTDDVTLQGVGRPTLTGAPGEGGERGQGDALPLHVDGADGVVVDGLAIRNREGPRAILVGASGSSGDTPSANVNDTVIRNNTIGPVVFDNPATDTGGETRGIFLRGQGENYTIANNTISDIVNTADGNANGILFSSFANDPVLEGVDVRNNTVTNVTTDSGEKAKGISVDGDIDDLTIADNEISDVGPSEKTRGIALTEDAGASPNRGPQDFQIRRNNFSALQASASSSFPAVVIQVGGYDTLGQNHVVTHNNLLGDAVERFSETSGADELIATENWWGSADGPGGLGPGPGTNVATFGPGGDVEFTPWLDAPFPGGQPTGPVKNIDQGTFHLTVQEGVDEASDGDRIEVESGVYEESVTVATPNLTVVGTGATNTTTLVSSGPKTVTLSARGVTLRDLAITNDGGGNGIDVPSSVDASGLEITNVRIYNTSIGFFADTDDNDPPSGELDGVLFSGVSVLDSERKGIYTEKLSNATIVDTVVDGVANDSYGFNNGIDINLKYNDYRNVTIRDTIVRNVTKGDPFDGTDAFSTAIAIKARDDPSAYDSNPATLTDVSLRNVTVVDSFNGVRIGEPGVDYAAGPQVPTNVIVRNSTIENVDGDGLVTLGQTVVDAEGNYWGSTAGPTIDVGSATADPRVVVGDGSGVPASANVDASPWQTAPGGATATAAIDGKELLVVTEAGVNGTETAQVYVTVNPLSAGTLVGSITSSTTALTTNATPVVIDRVGGDVTNVTAPLTFNVSTSEPGEFNLTAYDTGNDRTLNSDTGTQQFGDADSVADVNVTSEDGKLAVGTRSEVVSAQVLNASGVPVEKSGVDVSWSVQTDGTGVQDDRETTTNSSGVATLTLRNATATGNVSVTAIVKSRYSDSTTVEVVDPLSVSLDAVSGVGSKNATMVGNVTSLGVADSASVSFEYWVAGDRANTTATLDAGSVSTTGQFSAEVTDLSPSTDYVVRAIATSSATTDRSSNASFTTADPVALNLAANRTDVDPRDAVEFTVTRSDTGETVDANVTAGGTTRSTGPDGTVVFVFDTVGEFRVVSETTDTSRTAFSGDTLNVSVSLATNWTFSVGSRVQYAAPAVGSELVYAAGLGNEVYGVYRTNGTEAWQFDRSGSLSDSAPLLVGEDVIVGSGSGTLYALHAPNGTVDWTASTDSAITSSPAATGGTVFVGANDGEVLAVQADNGSTVWTANVGGPVYADLAVENETVYVSTADGKLVALNASTGDEVWRFDANTDVGHSSPLVANGTVYFSADELYALDAEAGTERWSAAEVSSDGSSPAHDNGTVYAGSGGGIVYALNASNGATEWTVDTNSSVKAKPAIVGDGSRVMVGTLDDVYLFEADGSQVANDRFGSVRAQPTVSGDVAYVGTRAGTVVALSNLIDPSATTSPTHTGGTAAANDDSSTGENTTRSNDSSSRSQSRSDDDSDDGENGRSKGRSDDDSGDRSRGR